MCGVVGYEPIEKGDRVARVSSLVRLAYESRVRGMHAYGLAQPEVVQKFSRLDSFLKALEEFDDEKPLIAHCRYSTSGDWTVPTNNQPIVVDNRALAFNGVISMGTKQEFEAQFDVKCDTENDGEIFLRRPEVLRFPKVSFAGVWLDGSVLCAARNERRPLWTCRAHGAEWFASTRDIFLRAGFSGMVEA